MARKLEAVAAALLFAAALALSLPGLEVARASESGASISEGPMCKATQPLPAPSLAQVTAAVQARAAAEAAAAGVPAHAVALNTRGYNYRTQLRVDDPVTIQRELLLAR